MYVFIVLRSIIEEKSIEEFKDLSIAGICHALAALNPRALSFEGACRASPMTSSPFGTLAAVSRAQTPCFRTPG
jgi:hypothetical protein